MLRYLRAVAPWIVFAIGSRFDWRYAAMAGLVVAVASVVEQRRRRIAWDALILECGAVVFFAVLTGYSVAVPDSSAKPYVRPMSDGCLAVIAWVSLLVRHPFTLGIARQTTPEPIWRTPLFYQVNAVITAAWAASFSVGACLYAFVEHTVTDPGKATTVIVVATFAVPILFTRRYPAIASARYRSDTSA